MKITFKIIVILVLLSPIVAFLVMGMFVYGLLPYPPETIEKVYNSDTGEKIVLKGVKQQGWGSDGFIWEGKYWPNQTSQPQTIPNWLGYYESFVPQVYFLDNFIVIIEDFRNFRVKTIADTWRSYSLWHRDYDYISSLDSVITSIKKDLPVQANPYIKEFIPASQKLVIEFSISPYDHTPTLATINLFISPMGNISAGLPKKFARYHS